MQHGLYPGFAKIQTRSDSLTSEDDEFQQKMPKKMAADGLHKDRNKDERYLEQFKETCNTTKKDAADHNATLCDCIFTDGSDNLELCIPNSKPCHGFHHENPSFHYSDNASIKRHEKGNELLNNRNQVRWWRNNITATMERFEPTQNNGPSTSAACLDYGLIARVVSSETETNNSSKVAQPPIMPSSGTVSKYNVYSYAYHEPGAVKYHTNLSPAHRSQVNTKIMSSNGAESSRNKQRNSFRTLLSRDSLSASKREQRPVSLSPFVENRHTYTTRHGTTENLYEEVSEYQLRNVPSDNGVALSTTDYVQEELRRVQSNHFRVLDELNLSLEALIMPPSPEKLSPSTANGVDYTFANKGGRSISPKQKPTTSKAALAQKPKRFGLLGGDSSSLSSAGQPMELSSTSLQDVSAFQLMEPKHSPHNLPSNPEFDEGDLDSGFSGSGSTSGASYNESLRNYKSCNILGFTRNQDFLQTKNTCPSPTSPSVSTSRGSVATQEDFSKSSGVSIVNGFAQKMSPKSFQNTTCKFFRNSDTHQISMRSKPMGICTGAKSKKSI